MECRCASTLAALAIQVRHRFHQQDPVTCVQPQADDAIEPQPSCPLWRAAELARRRGKPDKGLRSVGRSKFVLFGCEGSLGPWFAEDR